MKIRDNTQKINGNEGKPIPVISAVTSAMDRRTFLRAAPAAGIAVAALKVPVADASDVPDWWGRMVEVVERLEDASPFEMHLSVAAKAFAASEIRKAMGLPQRNEELVREYREATDIFIANGSRRSAAMKGGLV